MHLKICFAYIVHNNGFHCGIFIYTMYSDHTHLSFTLSYPLPLLLSPFFFSASPPSTSMSYLFMGWMTQ